MDESKLSVFAVSSPLGAIAIAGSGRTVHRVSFGHPTVAAAVAAIQAPLPPLQWGDWNHGLIRRLTDFCQGVADDFADVQLAGTGLTPFQRRVRAACRRVAFGDTITYAELAARSGSPQAARAVGNVMAANPFPIVVPCHRVVGSAGSLGGYSAPTGINLKRRLLELERSAVRAGRRTDELIAC